VLLALLALLVAGCRAEEPPPGEAGELPRSLRSTAFEGAVFDPLGNRARDVPVALIWIDPASGAETVLQHGNTDATGNYVLRSKRDGAHRVRVGGDGAPAAVFDVVVDEARNEVVVRDVHLAAERTARAEGILLSPEGLPLTRGEILFLFSDLVLPSTARDGALELHGAFSGRSGVYAAQRTVAGLVFGRIPAVLDAANARFFVDVPEGFAGEVIVEFRGVQAAAAPWPADGALLELVVDGAALRARLGTLEIRVQDPTSLETIEGGDVTIFHAAPPPDGRLVQQLAWPDVPGTLRLVDVPPGSYVVTARAPGRAAGSVEAEVAPGATARAIVLPAERATARVFVAALRPDQMDAAFEEFEVRTPGGAPLPHVRSMELVEGRACILLDEAPAGDVVLALGAHALRVRLAPGRNPDLSLELAPLRFAVFHVELALDARDPRPNAAYGRFIVRRSDGVTVIDDFIEAPIDTAGPGAWIAVGQELVPGRYDVVLDWGPLARVEERVAVPDLDGAEFVFPIE
jgi:hypothetical protein